MALMKEPEFKVGQVVWAGINGYQQIQSLQADAKYNYIYYFHGNSGFSTERALRGLTAKELGL